MRGGDEDHDAAANHTAQDRGRGRTAGAVRNSDCRAPSSAAGMHTCRQPDSRPAYFCRDDHCCRHLLSIRPEPARSRSPMPVHPVSAIDSSGHFPDTRHNAVREGAEEWGNGAEASPFSGVMPDFRGRFAALGSCIDQPSPILFFLTRLRACISLCLSLSPRMLASSSQSLSFQSFIPLLHRPRTGSVCGSAPVDNHSRALATSDQPRLLIGCCASS